MQMHSRFLNRHGVGALAAAVLALAIAPEARADSCSALAADQSTIVYISGSSAVKPFLAKASAVLLAQTPPIYVVYNTTQGSCTGVNTMTTTPAGTVNGTGAVIWDSTGAPIAGGCDIDVGGVPVDIGASDVYASTCGMTPTSDVTDDHGPIQVMTFAVPKASTANSISREAAYLVYGFGAASNAVAPWNDSTVIFQRNGSSGTQNMLATAIGVPAANWKPSANTNGKSDDMFNALIGAATAGNANKAIGILSMDYVDAHRDTVKPLAYQHTDQSCGYLPDSSSTAFDMANVRDGHYMVWGPLHLYVHRDAGGATLKPSIQRVLDLMGNATTLADADAITMITTEAKGGVVPDCAMHVSRTTEDGPLASYQPAKGCECAFLTSATGTAPSDCKTCTADADCATGGRGTHCNYGYCEVK